MIIYYVTFQAEGGGKSDRFQSFIPSDELTRLTFIDWITSKRLKVEEFHKAPCTVINCNVIKCPR
jgi:hypothetical protein